MIRVTENLRKIRNLLAEAAVDAGRDPATVRLLAVSKKQPVSAVRAAASASQLDFGENFAQEGVEKMAAMAPEMDQERLRWHFIGRIQSNKTRLLAENYDWIHTVDRAKTAERLSRQRPEHKAPINVCLQVNVDNETNKSGVQPSQVSELAALVSELAGLRLRGLMCLPAVRTNYEAQCQPFRTLKQLADEVSAAGIELDTLSMGMSADYRAAIHEGATIVRLGTAIFGPRR